MLSHVRVTRRFSLFRSVYNTRFYASRASAGGKEADEDDIKAARQWLSELDADTIRNNATCDVSFSRSSGPGGQNVNK